MAAEGEKKMITLKCSDGEEFEVGVRSPRMDRVDFMTNASRQIYLTFPADSTFSEEDVSNYFSPTFVYPETVKIILFKGNPHFVCGARVLVKPYKEKGKVPNKIRKLQPAPILIVAARPGVTILAALLAHPCFFVLLLLYFTSDPPLHCASFCPCYHEPQF